MSSVKTGTFRMATERDSRLVPILAGGNYRGAATATSGLLTLCAE